MRAAILRAAAVLLLLLLPWGAAAEDHPSPAMIAGLLPCTPEVEERWPWCGAWLFPVGDSLDFTADCGDEPGYKINRGVLTRDEDGTEHDGADLANGRAGGTVRAAASGIVVRAESPGHGGYGSNIVIAHRLEDGALVYSVYAHLIRGSALVHDGDVVAAGQVLARVGQTGRATTPHLHFEVRAGEDSTLRWEKCPVEDPVEFVRARLPEARADSDWATPYVAWAELAALVPRGSRGSSPLDAAMLSRALERAGLRDLGALGDANATAGEGGRDALDWNSIARGLTAIGTRPRRLPPCSIESSRYVHDCVERLGVRRPARELHRLAAREAPPTLGELCLALADFAAKSKHGAGTHPRHRRAHP